jgi:hypothetical protein
MSLFPDMNQERSKERSEVASNIVFVEAENLEGIFIDGKLVVTKEKLSPFDVCDALGISYVRVRFEGNLELE